MAAKEIYSFKINAHQALADIAEMSLPEIGLYFKLMLHQWTNGSIPEDPSRLNLDLTSYAPVKGSPEFAVEDLFELLDAYTKNGKRHSDPIGEANGESMAALSISQWRKHGGSICLISKPTHLMKSICHKFVSIGDGRLAIDWLTKTREKAYKFSTSQSDRGKKGAEARWNKEAVISTSSENGKRYQSAIGVAIGSIIVVVLNIISNTKQSTTLISQDEISQFLEKSAPGPDVILPELGIIRVVLEDPNEWWLGEVATFLRNHNWGSWLKMNKVTSVEYAATVLMTFLRNLVEGSVRDGSGKISSHFRNWWIKAQSSDLIAKIGQASEAKTIKNGSPDPKIRGVSWDGDTAVKLSDETVQQLGENQLVRKQMNELKPSDLFKNFIE